MHRPDVGRRCPRGSECACWAAPTAQVEVRASGGLFGLGASVDAVAGASEGKLVVHPAGLLLGGLRLTLFSDPHVYVEGVGATVTPARPLSYRLSMSARLH